MGVSTEIAVPFSRPVIGQGEIDEVVAALTSGWLSSGPRVRQFEEAFAAYVGAPYAVAPSNRLMCSRKNSGKPP